MRKLILYCPDCSDAFVPSGNNATIYCRTCQQHFSLTATKVTAEMLATLPTPEPKFGTAEYFGSVEYHIDDAFYAHALGVKL